MAEPAIPQEILVITGPIRRDDSDLKPRRGTRRPRTREMVNTAGVHLSNLQGQVNIFLQQMNEVMHSAPENVGRFKLDEFEVSVGIVVEGKGEVKLALLASAEVGAKVDAGIKFVFKRS